MRERERKPAEMCKLKMVFLWRQRPVSVECAKTSNNNKIAR